MYTSVGAVGGEIKKKKEKVTALKGEGTTTTSNNCLYIKQLDFFTEIQFVHVQCVKKKIVSLFREKKAVLVSQSNEYEENHNKT